MSRAPLLLLGTLAVMLSAPMVMAKSKPKTDPALIARQIAHGQTVFTRVCAPCHGQGPGDDGPKHLPGTQALENRYKGAMPGALELRTDLSAELLRHFVRNGSGAMPMFRKTEVSDADLDAIAAYIADNAAKAGKPRR